MKLEDTEELALNIAGKRKKLAKKQFIAFAHGQGLNKKQIAGVFKHFNDSKNGLLSYSKNLF